MFSVFTLFFLAEAFPLKYPSFQPQYNQTNSNHANSFLKTDVKDVKDGMFILTYTIGNRLEGDHLEAKKSGAIFQSTPQDYTQTLYYPENNNYGRQITYIEIIVQQTGPRGEIRVIKGGIGKPYIVLTVKSQNTLLFIYNATLYTF